MAYNALVYRLHRVPVHSVVVLLRPQAAHPNLTGVVRYAREGRAGKMDFGYEVVKLWEQPAEELLRGPTGTLPLAMLGKLPEGVASQEALTGVVQLLTQRLQAETPARAEHLPTAAYVLAGMRVTRAVAQNIFSGVRAMRESDTYMAIIDEGREAEARKLIVRLAQKSLGPPEGAILTRLEGIADVERLERIFDRAGEAASWQDLLDTP